jgi:soluble lytic murein transglycosylase-like protein
MCRQLFAVVAVTGVLGASFALSETRPAFEDFSAKRVKPPGAGSRAPRITVQIDPVEQARRLAPPEPVATAPDPVESADAVESATAESGKAASPKFAWFWEKLSPDLTGAGAGRLIDALDVLAGAEETVPAPRLQALQEIAVLRGVEILGATVGTRVSPALVLAVIAVESAGKVDAKSRAGA